MELLKKARETINKYSMLSDGDHVLIGLSGGADSVCLVRVLNQLRQEFNLTLSAVYVDHGLRPDETKREESFCRALCNGLGVSLHIRKIDTRKYAKDRKLNIQEAARILRYQVYEGLSDEIKATKIAVGHTADDQTETFLMRLFRGSGLTGLSGIPPVRSLEFGVKSSARPASQSEAGELRVRENLLIIRPLIEVERSEIEKFLSQNFSLFTFHSSLSFIVDSSNLKRKYLRNRIRLAVMPELKKQNPSLVRNICKVADILREEDTYIERIVTKTLMRLISRKSNDTVELFLSLLETMDIALLRRVLRRVISITEGLRGIDFTHIENIIRLIRDGKSGDRLYLPEGIKVVKGYSTILFTSRPVLKLLPCTFMVPGGLELKEAGITLKADISEEAGGESYNGKTSAVIDLDKLKLPLEVRSRKNGDYFYPAGFGKRKKLQDFFVDNKIPKDDRDTIPILVSGEDIVWVVGYRMDERFRAKEDTKRFLIIRSV